MGTNASHAVVQAMEEVKAGTKSPYAVARDAGIALSTMYRSRLYKAWKAEQESQEPSQDAPPPPSSRQR